MEHKDFFGGAKWMSPEKDAVTCVRGEFRLPAKPESAKIEIIGLGMFRLQINGKPVGDDLFGTLITDFHVSPEEKCVKLFGENPAHRLYVSEFDITKLLESENCLAVTLAPGWYHAYYTKWGDSTNYGLPKLCFRLDCTLEDGRSFEYLSDETLRWHQSNVVKQFFFEGEEQDYDNINVEGWEKYGYDASDWQPLFECEIPETEFMSMPDCPPDRIIRYIKPKLIGEYDGGYLYDAFENITGTPVLKNRTKKRGERLVFRVSERLSEGKLDETTVHGQTSTFITDGGDRDYMLSFMWNGFRYIWASANAEVESVAVIHTDAAVTSGFRSDNRVLNWMFETFIRTQLDNMHCGIPSDCPHLEKHGYTGDGELICECGMLMLDSEGFYRKWIGDISDCQDRISGHVQYTAPYTRCGGGPGGWGCAIAEVPYQFWKYFGDEELAKSFIPQIKAYFGYLEAHSDERGLVVSDQKGEWCLGDWCTAEDIAIPEPYVNTYFYAKTIGRLIEITRLSGDEESIAELEALLESKKAAIDKNYFDASTGDYCGGIQGANAFALDLGLGDERTLKNLVKHYGEDNDFGYDTGIFGTDIVTRVLFERGYTDIAFSLMSSEQKYSFGRWMNDGCTTFPEYWTYKRSQNHPMFGAVTKYLFTEILGIKQETAGFGKIVIAPKLPQALGSVEGFVTLKSGRVSVRAVRNDGRVSFKIEVPKDAKFSFGGYETVLKAGTNELLI